MSFGTELAIKELGVYVKGGAHISRVSASMLAAELARKDNIIETLNEELMLRGIQITELRKAIEDKLQADSFSQVEKRRRGTTQKLRRLIGLDANK